MTSRSCVRPLHVALLLPLLMVLWLATLESTAAVYILPNRPHKQVAQDLKIVFSNTHDLMFCRDCDDPLAEGSIVIPQRLHTASETFFVNSVLVFAIPNDGSYALYNAHELAGKVAVFTRGKVSVAHKARVAQRAGAVAAMIMDTSKCDPETMHCHRTVSVSPLLQDISRGIDTIGGSERRRFDDDDPTSAWISISIPVAMVSADDAARIRSFMDLVEVDVNGQTNFLVDV